MALYGLFHTREQCLLFTKCQHFSYCGEIFDTFVRGSCEIQVKVGSQETPFFFGFRHFICYIATFTIFREIRSKPSIAETPLRGKPFYQTWFQLKYKFLHSSHCQAFLRHGLPHSKKVFGIYL